jgi:hypothetical protein
MIDWIIICWFSSSRKYFIHILEEQIPHQLILKHYIVNTHFEIMVRFFVYFSEQLVLQLFWLL